MGKLTAVAVGKLGRGTFLRDNEDMRGLLNAGHQPDTKVLRCVGEKPGCAPFRYSRLPPWRESGKYPQPLSIARLRSRCATG